MDTLIAFGDEIKALTETADGWQFEGRLIVFDTPDISPARDYFTKATVLDVEDGDERPVYYHHGRDGTIGKARIGKAQTFIRDDGLWVKGEIKKRQDYLARHVERIANGLKQTVECKGVTAPLFGLSSGAAPHLVSRQRQGLAHEIKSWAVSEISITPTPMEPLTGVHSIKAIIDEEEEESAAAVEAEVAEVDAVEANVVAANVAEVKAGRAVSAANHATLSALCEQLKSAAQELEAFLEQHRGDDDADGTLAIDESAAIDPFLPQRAAAAFASALAATAGVQL